MINNTEFDVLHELIRKAQELISPISYHHTLQWLTNPDVRSKHFEKNPLCYLKLGIGRKHALFPICNRSGVICPKMINFSLRMADKFYSLKNINADELNVIVKKLKRLQTKYNQDVPKPDNMAASKARDTKQFNLKMK